MRIFNIFMCLGFIYFLVALYPNTDLKGYMLVFSIVATGYYFIETVKEWLK